MAISTVFIVATFRRYSQLFQQKLCLPGRGRVVARRSTHCSSSRAKCTLCSPSPLSLSGVRAPLCRMCLCSARFVWLLQSSECACPSPTRMGETAPRRRCKQDHRPIAFSGKRWWWRRGLPSPGQCPHTCRGQAFWLARSFLGGLSFARLQCGSETGARWRVDGRPVAVHTLLSLLPRSHTSLDRRWPGGQEGAWVGPKMQTGQSQVQLARVSCQCQSGFCLVD